MLVNGWQVASMKRVYWTTREFMNNLSIVRHLGTDTHSVEGQVQLQRGTTVWGAEVGDEWFAMAWEWCQVRGRTVALADPMYVISNVLLVDDDGLLMDQGRRVVHLNSAVYCLNWQSVVMAAGRPCEERMAA
jgi:hypothetical protein